jgi:DNA repair protein RadA/Sms
LQQLSEIEAREAERVPTGIGEFDRALGGGLVPGGVVLIGGDPGIGKSTLLLQACAHLSKAGKRILYASGEESLEQIAMRARRLGGIPGEFKLLSDTSLFFGYTPMFPISGYTGHGSGLPCSTMSNADIA